MNAWAIAGYYLAGLMVLAGVAALIAEPHRTLIGLIAVVAGWLVVWVREARKMVERHHELERLRAHYSALYVEALAHLEETR